MTTSGDDVAAAAASVRRWVDAATWTAIGLGLAFTAVNVQVFAAAGASAWSPGWVVAWLLDPMVSVLLLAVVRAEQVTARWQVAMPWQVAAVKWAAFAATYAMNSWAAWAGGSPAAVLLHSVPPVFVLLAAEVAPALRERLTEAVHVATAASPAPGRDTSSAPEAPAEKPSRHEPTDTPATDTPAAPIPEPESESGPDLGERPGPDLGERPGPDLGERPGVVSDARVVELAELLAAGCEVSGPQVAVLHGVSDRTGRRLLADARAHLEQHPPSTRPDLHLVEARTVRIAGGTR